MVEVRRAGQLGHRDLAGVGEVRVDLVALRRGPHAEHAVLRVQDAGRVAGFVGRQVVGDLGGLADAEVDVGARGDVAADDRGELVHGQRAAVCVFDHGISDRGL